MSVFYFISRFSTGYVESYKQRLAILPRRIEFIFFLELGLPLGVTERMFIFADGPSVGGNLNLLKFLLKIQMFITFLEIELLSSDKKRLKDKNQGHLLTSNLL